MHVCWDGAQARALVSGATTIILLSPASRQVIRERDKPVWSKV